MTFTHVIYYGWEVNREKLLKYINNHFEISSDDDLTDEYLILGDAFDIEFEKLEFTSRYIVDANGNGCYRNYVFITSQLVTCDKFNVIMAEFNPKQELKNIPKADLRKAKRVGCEGSPKIIFVS